MIRRRSFFVAAAMKRTPSTRWSFRRNSGVSSSVSVAFSTVAITPSIISLWLASCCDKIVIVGHSTLGVVSFCRHTLGSTRLIHISFSTSVVSVSVLFSVCVAVVVLAVSISASVLITVCVAVVDMAASILGLSIFGLFQSTTVVFNVELPPNLIFGKFDCFDLVISSLASATDAVEVDGVGDFVFFICFPLVGGRLWHLGSERLSTRSDAFCQSSEISVRPRGLFVLNSAGMNPPEKFFFSFLLIVSKLIALIEVLSHLKIFECERVDCLWSDHMVLCFDWPNYLEWRCQSFPGCLWMY